MALDAEAKHGVEVEELSEQSLHCAISSVEMLAALGRLPVESRRIDVID